MERPLYLNGKEIISSRILKSLLMVIIIAISLVPRNLYAQKIQSGSADSTKVLGAANPEPTIKTTYPKVVGYLSFIVPVVTLNKA
jgi:hypothetical protein